MLSRANVIQSGWPVTVRFRRPDRDLSILLHKRTTGHCALGTERVIVYYAVVVLGKRTQWRISCGGPEAINSLQNF